MPGTFPATCPACKRAFDVPADKAGGKVECPDCFEVFEAEKPGKPEVKVVFVDGPPPKKRGRKPPRRRDEDDGDDDYAPPAGRRAYEGIRSPGVALALGVLSLVFACVPLLGLIFAVAALAGPSADVYHPADRPTVRTGKWLARATLGLYVIVVLAALGYFSR